jgi:lipopolysaccharide/colanic/teichoic acid biosynthesis glycosyltransferase
MTAVQSSNVSSGSTRDNNSPSGTSAASPAPTESGVVPPVTSSRRLAALPTLWGLDPIQLHDYYWAARGVQVVRLGEPSSVVGSAELFLLTNRDTLVLFRMRSLVETVSWIAPLVLLTRVHETLQRPYQEHAVVESDGTLRRFVRTYARTYTRTIRVAFTTDPDIARAWMAMHDTCRPWRHLRRQIPAARREVTSIRGHLYDQSSLADLDRFTKDLLRLWPQPSSVIHRAQNRKNVWADPQASISKGTRFVGEVWIGAGRTLAPDDLVVGPVILWDDPACRPAVQTIQWHDLEPATIYRQPQNVPQRSTLSRHAKRLFDIVFALCAILLTLPLYPLVMLAILLEDGRPFFFAHSRETIGGREFPCIKFRSMRKDAEKIKAELRVQNQADGPQFYIENDPRLTRVGRIIRKANIDELPQFFNVLLGHMSIVGPRPSPHQENQFCPAWREARLSVRPGVTGLWQVNRTRIRGSDFQEWIKYDIQYVESQSWLLDLRIIWKTFTVILRGMTSL